MPSIIEPLVHLLQAHLTIVPDAEMLHPTEVDLVFWPIIEFSSAAAARFDAYQVSIILLAPQNYDYVPCRPQRRRWRTIDYTAVFPFDPQEIAVVATQMLMRSVTRRFTERRLRKRDATYVDQFDSPADDDTDKH
jgi:hypothetical protein